MWYMNEERELLQAAFREFAQTRVRPHVAKMEEEDANAKQLIKEMGELGFLGLTMEEEYGGSGRDYINWALLMEEIGKESYTVGLLAMIAHLFNRGMAFPNACTEEQIKKYLIPAVQGEHVMGLAGCEASGGSFFDGFETVAKREGDDWVINGSKVFITQCDVADYFLVMARTKDHVDPMTFDGMDMFIVAANTEGVSTGHIENKLGWNGSRTGCLYFNDVRVSEADHMKIGMVFVPEEHGGSYAALSLGAAETVIEKTVSYLKQRIQYGVSLWDSHESMRNDIAKLVAKVSNFRNATYGHMANMTNGVRISSEALALKIEGAKLLEEVTSECMTLMGGVGIVYETGIERFYRDNKTSELGCVSNKTALSYIAYAL